MSIISVLVDGNIHWRVECDKLFSVVTSPRYKQRLRFWPMVAVMYVLLCGGPYGIEEIVPQYVV